MCATTLQYKAEISKLEHKRNTTSMSLQDEKALIKQIEKVRTNCYYNIRLIYCRSNPFACFARRFAHCSSQLSQQTKLYTSFHAYQAQTDEMKKVRREKQFEHRTIHSKPLLVTELVCLARRNQEEGRRHYGVAPGRGQAPNGCQPGMQAL